MKNAAQTGQTGRVLHLRLSHHQRDDLIRGACNTSVSMAHCKSRRAAHANDTLLDNRRSCCCPPAHSPTAALMPVKQYPSASKLELRLLWYSMKLINEPCDIRLCRTRVPPCASRGCQLVSSGLKRGWPMRKSLFDRAGQCSDWRELITAVPKAMSMLSQATACRNECARRRGRSRRRSWALRWS